MSRLWAPDDSHSKTENEDIGTGHRVSPTGVHPSEMLESACLKTLKMTRARNPLTPCCWMVKEGIGYFLQILFYSFNTSVAYPFVSSCSLCE